MKYNIPTRYNEINSSGIILDHNLYTMINIIYNYKLSFTTYSNEHSVEFFCSTLTFIK